MNSRAAVLTRLRAASCGSRSPGSRGAATPRSWVAISATIATASSSQATQPMIVIAASATLPSSGLSSPARSSSQVGMWLGMGLPPRARRVAGRPIRMPARARAASRPRSRRRMGSSFVPVDGADGAGFAGAGDGDLVDADDAQELGVVVGGGGDQTVVPPRSRTVPDISEAAR